MLHALTYRGGLLKADLVQGIQLRHVFADIHTLGLQTVLCKKSHRFPDAALHIRRGGNQRVLSDLYVGLVLRLLRRILHDLGHEEGDRVLRETASIIAEAFGKEYSYRYGGDEFLVLTHKPAEYNYGSFTYDFTEEQYGVKAVLSIGNAHGSPGSYQELFDLISRADKALYIVKERTHSAEFGGHDRRKNRRI